MRLLTLPKLLRDAGLTVHEVDGWKSRGDSDFGPLRGITCHHTAGSRTSTDSGEIRTLVHGSTSAPGPIAQLYLSRTGAWHVVASGVCWHNLKGWAGPNRGLDNYNLLGIEAQHSGAGEPWTAVQYQSYVRGVAALCAGLGVPVGRVAGHKEHQPGSKSDPTFDMTKFRADVARTITDGDDMQLTDLVYTDTTGKKRTVGSILGTLDVIVRRDEQATKAALEKVLTAVADDDTPVTIPAEQIPVLAAQLAAAMPTAASIADAVNDDAAARLSD